MTLTIYGSPRSRTMRVLWLAAELQGNEEVPVTGRCYRHNRP
jgi:hypothetical protein